MTHLKPPREAASATLRDDGGGPHQRSFFPPLAGLLAAVVLAGCATPTGPMTAEKAIRAGQDQPAVFTLSQPWQKYRDVAFRPTRVELRWQPDALLVEAELDDADAISSSTADGQKMWELGDVFEMFVQVGGRTDYVEMHVTPHGHRLHLQLPGTFGRRPDGSVATFEEMLVRPPAFDATAERTARGWRVRAAIPARVLGLDNFDAGRRLRVSFCRYDASPSAPPVLSTSARHPVVSFHRPDEWTRVTLVSP